MYLFLVQLPVVASFIDSSRGVQKNLNWEEFVLRMSTESRRIHSYYKYSHVRGDREWIMLLWMGFRPSSSCSNDIQISYE